MIEYRIRIHNGGVTVTQRIESASKTIRKGPPKHEPGPIEDDDKDKDAAMRTSTASNATAGAASAATPADAGARRSMSLPAKFPAAFGGGHPVPGPDECSCPVAIVFGPIILFGSLDDVVGGPEDKSGTGS